MKFPLVSTNNEGMNVDENKVSGLKKRKLSKLLADPEAAARAVELVYVNDSELVGIHRLKKGKNFSYIYEKKKVDKRTQQRIKQLSIPPAWENVWICALENGHLQATGLDARKRKQYRYHPIWNALRNHLKFYRMLQFGEALPVIRLQVEKDLQEKGITQRKVLATVVSLMERTNIRIGNQIYEKLYGSFGLTTLKDKHVDIKNGNIKFSFVGKKGIRHDIDIRHKKLAKIVQDCKEIPGKELFQYYDEEGNRQSIDSGSVNQYIKEISGADFSAKDFRTWAGTLNALIAFNEVGISGNESETKKKIVEVLDRVANHLGNTRTVCKKYYVHPLLLSLYENQGIKKYLKELDKIEKPDKKSGLTVEEEILMKLLAQEK